MRLMKDACYYSNSTSCSIKVIPICEASLSIQLISLPWIEHTHFKEKTMGFKKISMKVESMEKKTVNLEKIES